MSEVSFGSRIKHAWNAFFNRDPTEDYREAGTTYTYVRPDRPRLTGGNDRTIVTSMCNRIARDVSNISIRHVQLDDAGRYLEDIPSKLNQCLTVEANIDQSARLFIHDVVLSMCDEGCIAVVPVDTIGGDPTISSSYDVVSMRTGKILEWRPRHVKIRLYNDRIGKQEDILLPKSSVAIIENPLYAIMNEPNSTMKRLVRKLSLLDAVDEQSSSGKLDIIIQVPYAIKTDAHRNRADTRRKDIETQLAGSKYGIAYIDSSERVTQLNRPVENNLMKQIEYLTSMLYSQSGFHQSILDGTADEKTMLNYTNSIVKQFVSAIVDEMKRKFISKTARTQGQSIQYFIDPFASVSVADMAEAADKFTRNEILSKNEVRQAMGYKPSSDPKADQLINSNITQPTEAAKPEESATEKFAKKEESQNG